MVSGKSLCSASRVGDSLGSESSVIDSLRFKHQAPNGASTACLLINPKTAHGTIKRYTYGPAPRQSKNPTSLIVINDTLNQILNLSTLLQRISSRAK